MAQKNGGQHVSLQIFWKLHDRIAWKYCEYRVLACLFTHYRLVWWRHTLRHSFIYFRSHTARDTVRYLQRNNVAFIEPDVWPPNSPDLNPVNYAVFFGGGALQQLVYQHRSFTSVAELKQAIINAWQELSQSLLTEASTNGVVALSAWHIRMGAEHLFK